MDLKKLDEEARLAALKTIKNMVQRPSQLEKLDQYREFWLFLYCMLSHGPFPFIAGRRVSRKKASVEQLLKTAMQNQLDGIRIGVTQLTVCLDDISAGKRGFLIKYFLSSISIHFMDNLKFHIFINL